MKVYKKLWQNSFTKVSCVLGGALIGIATIPNNDFEIAKNLEIFSNVYKELNTFYVDEIDPTELMQKGMNSMLNSLDPYTVYIPPEEVAAFRSTITGKYGGIGASVIQRDGYSLVTEVYKGSPSEKAGIRAGDILVTADGETLGDKTDRETTIMLRGVPGTKVEITIERQGENKQVIVERGEIHIDNVPHYGVKDGMGYIFLKTFSESAGRNVANALKEMKEQEPNLKGVILDLRDNSGGLLSEAVNVTNIFVPKGEMVVQIKGKNKEQQQNFRTLNQPVDTEIPLVVLINNRSASASEIVAGAIQDLDRGIIVGERSFGKGLVQNTRDVSFGAKVKLTTARYYIPSGRCIQASNYKDGKPVPTPDSLRMEFETQNGRAVYDGGGIEPDIQTAHEAEREILNALARQYAILDYGTMYCNEYPDKVAKSDFQLSDADFEDFLTFLQETNFTFSTETEKLIGQLEKNAVEEHYDVLLAGNLENLKTILQKDKLRELRTHKVAIMRALQIEIVKRYHYRSGAIANTMPLDEDLAKAITLINDTKTYTNTLKGK